LSEDGLAGSARRFAIIIDSETAFVPAQPPGITNMGSRVVFFPKSIYNGFYFLFILYIKDLRNMAAAQYTVLPLARSVDGFIEGLTQG
jgi:hypothetical protein